VSERLSDYDFDLPRELIASRPLAERSASRMMVVDRATETISHRAFRDLSEFLHPGDLNNGAGQRALTRASKGAPASVGKFLEDEDFDFSVIGQQTRRNDPRVVEDEQITGMEKLR